MKLNKLAAFMILLLLAAMPFAGAITPGSLGLAGSKLKSTLDMESYILDSGMVYSKYIGLHEGKYCFKEGMPPELGNPPAGDYFKSLDDLAIPQNFEFTAETKYLQAKHESLNERISLLDHAISDDSVQQYSVFANDPIYMNTQYGMYFTMIYDSLTFANEAVQIIGILHESATLGATWLNYGYITDSGDVTIDFRDYANTQLVFNGLMEQMDETGYLEQAVEYAADVLGSQMQDQAGHNNIFQAHQQIDVAGNSMQRAQDFFHTSNIAEAAGNHYLAQTLDFAGMMNMAEGLYSAGESYKLKAMVLLMLIDGTLRDGVGLKNKIAAQPGSPCTLEFPKMCPVQVIPGLERQIEICCPANCPPGYYIQDQRSACWGGGIHLPGAFPTPGGAPGPSLAGSAVASLTDDFHIFNFEKEKLPFEQLKEWRETAERLRDKFREKANSMPADTKPDEKLAAHTNLKSTSTAIDAIFKINVPEASITPPKIKYNEKPVTVIPQENQVLLLSESKKEIAAIKTSTPQADAASLNLNPEKYAKELTKAGIEFEPAKKQIQGIPAEISSAGYLVSTETGERIKYLGTKTGFDNAQLKLANKRMELLYKIAEYENKNRPLQGEDKKYYLAAKRDELLILLDAIYKQYQFELPEINAKNTGFKEKNTLTNALYADTSQNLINAIEGTITDTRIQKFAQAIPENKAFLTPLIDKRKKATDYEITAGINKEILAIIYNTNIAEYYAGLKANNKPLDIQ